MMLDGLPKMAVGAAFHGFHLIMDDWGATCILQPSLSEGGLSCCSITKERVCHRKQ
jgi:hypothetical protein